MQNYTKPGLLLILIGMIIGIIGAILFGLYGFFVPVENVNDFLRYIGWGIIGGIGGFLSFIGGILFFVGRKEFGERHQQFVIYALLCIVIGIIASIAISITSTFIMMPTSEVVNRDFSWASAVVMLPSIISAITGGLAYVFALHELESNNGRKILYIAFVVSLLISVIIAFMITGVVNEMIGEATNTNAYGDFSTIASYTSSITQFSVYGVISSFFWFIAVYIPYKRIKNGELVPQSINSFSKDSSTLDRVCPNCNKVIPNDANICPYCGKNFDNYL